MVKYICRSIFFDTVLFVILKALVIVLYNVGDKVLYPMHGAGIIEKIESQDILGNVKDYYVLKMPMDGMKVKIPVDNADVIGVRTVIDTKEADAVFEFIEKYQGEFNSNWNKRYRENIAHIKSGDVYEVAGVVKMLMCRDKEKTLSSGERKMLVSAKQILISEIMLSKNVSSDNVENKLEKIIDRAVGK